MTSVMVSFGAIGLVAESSHQVVLVASLNKDMQRSCDRAAERGCATTCTSIKCR